MPPSAAELAERIRREAFLYRKSFRHLVTPKPPAAQTVFVGGVQRSGTNMLMQILDASLETDVFHENDERAFDNYMMRERPIIHSLIVGSRASVVVVKALTEAHNFKALLDEFAPAKGLWMIRRFEDAVNSTLKRWPGIRNMLDELVFDRDAAGWRGRGMTDETHRAVRALYRFKMNDASANALFWYYRNQLFFDQELDRDARVLAVEYERLVQAPRAEVNRIAAFTGIRSTTRMRDVPHTESVGRDAPPTIEAEVRALCEAMQERLASAAAKLAVRV